VLGHRGLREAGLLLQRGHERTGGLLARHLEQLEDPAPDGVAERLEDPRGRVVHYASGSVV
jgi:hypothetical protein